MSASQSLTSRLPKKLPESTYYRACIDGFHIMLKIGKTRFHCEVSKDGYSSRLETLSRTNKLLDENRNAYEVDTGTVRNIRAWVATKNLPAPTPAERKPAGRPPKKRLIRPGTTCSHPVTA